MQDGSFIIYSILMVYGQPVDKYSLIQNAQIIHFSVCKPLILFVSPVVSNESLFVFCCQVLYLLECDEYHSMILLLSVHRQITESAI